MAAGADGAPSGRDVRGTLGVTVLKAENLPNMDFAKRQDPYVQVSLNEDEEGTDAMQMTGYTDVCVRGGQNPMWTEQDNRVVELFWSGKQSHALLTLRVFNDDVCGHDQLIGIGQVDVKEIIPKEMVSSITDSKQYTVTLREALNSSAPARGKVIINVAFGPPVRKAFRAAQRIRRLLDVRDFLVNNMIYYACCATVSLSSKSNKICSTPREFMKNHKKLCLAGAAALGIVAAGAGAFLLMIVVPLVVLTFPFWIIPVSVTGLLTAPIWVPMLGCVLMMLFMGATLIFGLGMTSRPVRKHGALLGAKLKQTEVGRRVVYEKTAASM